MLEREQLARQTYAASEDRRDHGDWRSPRLDGMMVPSRLL
jgi:hypothetical protein